MLLLMRPRDPNPINGGWPLAVPYSLPPPLPTQTLLLSFVIVQIRPLPASRDTGVTQTDGPLTFFLCRSFCSLCARSVLPSGATFRRSARIHKRCPLPSLGCVFAQTARYHLRLPNRVIVLSRSCKTVGLFPPSMNFFNTFHPPALIRRFCDDK